MIFSFGKVTFVGHRRLQIFVEKRKSEMIVELSKRRLIVREREEKKVSMDSQHRLSLVMHMLSSLMKDPLRRLMTSPMFR